MKSPDSQFGQRIRGQSEVIGTILLVGVVVITVGVVGAAMTANTVSQSPSDRILIDCRIALVDGDVVISHNSGETAAIDDLEVLLRNDTDTTRRPLVVDTGDGDNRFELGEQAQLGPIGTVTEVFLLGPEQVVCRETLSPPA